MTMDPHYTDDAVTIYPGDCLAVLAELPDGSVDAVVTDPPYGLEFMGAEWDSFKPSSARIRTRIDGRTNPASGKSVTVTPEAYVAGAPFQQWCQSWAAECLRVLKPGGHMLAFGGSRTWHRLACAVEDAGFEIRDSIAWMYGSGFPKSLDVSKAIDKAAGAEREVIGPGINYEAKVKHGGTWTGSVYAQDPYTGAAGPVITAPSTVEAKQWQGWGTALKPAFEPIVVGRKPLAGTVAQNVTEHGTGALNIDGCRIDGRERTEYGLAAAKRSKVATYGTPSESADFDASKGRWPANVVLDEAAAAEVDRQSGWSKSPTSTGRGAGGRHGTYSPLGAQGKVWAPGDEGGASRFFYTAKAGADERPEVDGVRHPTVKPLSLMRWLVRLVTPPGGIVLDPFAGSGTTAEACVHERLRCIAIEREASYLPLIVARLSKPIAVGFDFEENAAPTVPSESGDQYVMEEEQ